MITEEDRTAHVTEEVQRWILGSLDHLPQAVAYAHQDPSGETMGNYLRGVLHRPAWGTRTFSFRMDLSDRDLVERISWDVIAKRLIRISLDEAEQAAEAG